MIIEIAKFLIYCFFIVVICKYILVIILRKLAQSLDLSARTIGNIAGFATSVPELLTISFSAFAGLVSTSIYNIISSNIINFIQYIFSIFLNGNQKIIKNKAIQTDIILVVFTILLPIILKIFNIPFELSTIPIFLLLLLLFYYINNNVHKLYLKKQDKKIEEKMEKEKKWVKGKTKLVIKYYTFLFITSVILYMIGNALSTCLNNLTVSFKIPQSLLGIVLGFITSIPELITFFESQKYNNKKETQELGVVEATNNLLTSNIVNAFVIQIIAITIYSFFF